MGIHEKKHRWCYLEVMIFLSQTLDVCWLNRSLLDWKMTVTRCRAGLSFPKADSRCDYYDLFINNHTLAVVCLSYDWTTSLTTATAQERLFLYHVSDNYSTP